jgi:hypothetical protein
VLLPLAIGAQVADVADGFNKLANHPFLTKNRGKPVSKDANNRSSQGIRLSDKGNKRDVVSVPTGSQEYNDYRRKQIEAEKARLKNVGNPPARPASPATSSGRSGGGGATGSSRPSPAPRSTAPKPPASAPKPPNVAKVETETTDAPKPPISEATSTKKESLKISSGRRPVGREEMIEYNMRRRKKQG